MNQRNDVSIQQINCQEGILHISNGATEKEYCLVYNRSWTPLQPSPDAAVSLDFIFGHSLIVALH